MIIGYARVSTEDQSLQIQEQAIQEYAQNQGEEYIIYQEKQNGGKVDREELYHALKATQRGNKFVIYKLDRLARSTKQLYQISDELQKKELSLSVSRTISIRSHPPAGLCLACWLCLRNLKEILSKKEHRLDCKQQGKEEEPVEDLK